MANTQAQFGFQHFGYLSGGQADYQLNKGLIQSTYTTKIYFGDPVVKSAASQYIIPATGTGNLTSIWGIFQGCQYTPSGGGIPTWSPWWPGAAASDATAYILDAPNALFKVAALLTAVPATAIGQNIGFSTGAGGTTVGGGFSTYVVDQSTLTTGSTAPFQVHSMYPGVGNGSDTTSSYNWVIVGFNNQRYKTTTGVA
jgi:hypothetical protein